jgi:hypothetical protein
MEELIADFSQFSPYKHIPPAVIEDERLNTALLNTQRGQIRDLLGRSLYLDMVNNLSDSRYLKLIGGETYTFNGNSIQFFGLRPALLWYAYALYLQDIAVTPTRTGLKVRTGVDGGEAVDKDSLIEEKSRAFAQGDMYAAEVREYLERNAATYPLYAKREVSTSRNPQSMKISVITQPPFNFQTR